MVALPYKVSFLRSLLNVQSISCSEYELLTGKVIPIVINPILGSNKKLLCRCLQRDADRVCTLTQEMSTQIWIGRPPAVYAEMKSKQVHVRMLASQSRVLSSLYAAHKVLALVCSMSTHCLPTPRTTCTFDT